MTREAAVYVRISQDRTGHGLGVSRQREDCLELASALGWRIVEVFEDDDISAYSGKRRPGYEELLAALRDGRVDAVVVWHTDRLHRSPRELEEYLDIAEPRGVITQTVKAGEIDLATPAGRAVARTLGAWARYESEHKADRVQRAQRQAIEAGRWTGGSRPLGWQFEDGRPVIDDAEAMKVREATRGVLNGLSLGHFVRKWNAEGFTTSTGRPWNYTSLKQVLRRARNAGLSTWKGEVVGTSEFPAIVSEEEWRAACHVLDNPERKKAQSNRVKYLLPGIARCECGEPVMSGLATGRGGTRRRIYRCRQRGPGHVAKNQVDVDALVEELMIRRLSKQDAASALTSLPEGRLQDLRSEAVALRGRLEELERMLEDPSIPLAAYESAATKVRGRLQDIDQELVGALQGRAVARLSGTEARQKWAEASLEERRSAIRLLADIRLLRTASGSRREFHPETVEVVWR